MKTSSLFMTSHWTNFVEVDPAHNHEAGDKWIGWFNKVKDDPNRYTAKNTAQLHSQFLYRKFAQISVTGDTVLIDNTDLEIRQRRYEAPILSMLIRGRNIQGQRGVITIESGPPREQR